VDVSIARAVITGLSANTSMGDAVTACAAARARMARPAPLDAVAFDLEDGAEPIVGHPVPTVSGFQGEARLLSLGIPALRELAKDGALDSLGEVGFFLGLPDHPAPSPSKLLDRLLSMSGLPNEPTHREAFPAGHTGFALAVRAAIQTFEEGRLKACVVGGIDSLCDDLALDSLEDRLKTGSNPVGLQPGEAAAFVVLEAPSWARRRKAQVRAMVTGVAVAREPRAREDFPVGQGLTQAIAQLEAEGGPTPAGGTFFVLDRNGENIRAADWGYCQQRLTKKMKGLLPAPEWDLATNFGDTGAASGALGTLMVVRGFERGYASRPCGVVLSSSDGGERAALRIEGPT
jgi:3-oxoacyl-[acyl-carrier-protein] synthase-1